MNAAGQQGGVNDAGPQWPPLLPSYRTISLPGRGDIAVHDIAGPPGAPVVMLLHGWTVTADLNWCTVYAALAEHYRVVAFDHRGHGRGLRPREQFRLRDCADDAVAVADALGIDRFIAVGYSMGGAIATLLWLGHRDRVDGLVFAATACRFADQRNVRAQLALLGPVGAALRAVPRRAAQRGFASAIGWRTNGRGFHQWVIEQVASGDPRLVTQAGTEVRRFDSRGLVPAIDVPTSVIVMDRDTILATRLQDELVHWLRAPHVFRIDGDHDVCIRDGATFAATLVNACAAVANAPIAHEVAS